MEGMKMNTQASSAHGSRHRAPNPSVAYALGDAFERTRPAAANHRGVDPHKVSLIASFANDQRCSGLDAINLIRAFEDTFDLKIPNDVVTIIITMPDTVKDFGQWNNLLRPEVSGS
jgi:acyl carrier protein